LKRAIRFVALATLTAFACFTLEAIMIAVWHIWLSGHGMTSWLDREQTFPLIGSSTPLDVAAVLSSLAVGFCLAFALDRGVRTRR
jgi:ABC-type Fe3+ transport system permease subunit